MQNQSVLLMGLRSPIAQRLAERRIPFVVWHDKPIRRRIDGSLRVIDNVPFPQTAKAAFHVLGQLFPSNQSFSHVIAGTEASVVAASFARERFGSRATDHGMAVRCHDKRLMKAHLRNRGIPIIPYVDPQEDAITIPELIQHLGLPVVIKATNLSGRQGMTLAHSAEQLAQLWTDTRRQRSDQPSFQEFAVEDGQISLCEHRALQDTNDASQSDAGDGEVFYAKSNVQTESVFEPDQSVFETATQFKLIQDANQSRTSFGESTLDHRDPTSFLFERWVDVPEVSVESWVEQRQIQFTSITEYVDKTWVNLVPSRYAPATHQKILELNHRVLEELNIEWGLTHVEYFLDGDRIFLGEIAWRPPGGYLMDLISLAYGFDAWEAFLNVQLGLPTQFPDQPVQAAAAVLFHPGAGLIRHIEGVDTIQCAPNLSQFRLLCQVGRRLAPRTKVSNAAAYAIFAAPEVDTVLQSIVFARKTLRFNLIR